MAQLPTPHAPAGSAPALGFTPNPHHERAQRGEAASGAALQALQLALEFAKVKPEDKRTREEMVADAQSFVDFMARVLNGA